VKTIQTPQDANTDYHPMRQAATQFNDLDGFKKHYTESAANTVSLRQPTSHKKSEKHDGQKPINGHHYALFGFSREHVAAGAKPPDLRQKMPHMAQRHTKQRWLRAMQQQINGSGKLIPSGHKETSFRPYS
jgi:hypothetical protein